MHFLYLHLQTYAGNYADLRKFQSPYPLQSVKLYNTPLRKGIVWKMKNNTARMPT